MKKAPEEFLTSRLLFRRPKGSDAKAILARYASDPEVTRYLGWPRHESLKQTRNFIEYSHDQWDRWPAGPYLVFLREESLLIGGTGFSFETPYRAETGYLICKRCVGKRLCHRKFRSGHYNCSHPKHSSSLCKLSCRSSEFLAGS